MSHMKFIFKITYHTSYISRYITNIICSYASSFGEKFWPFKKLTSENLNIINKANVKKYLESFSKFKPLYKGVYSRQDMEECFRRINKCLLGHLKIAKIFNRNSYNKGSWIDQHMYPLANKHWKSFPYDNPATFFFIVIALLTLKDSNIEGFYDMVNYIRFNQFYMKLDRFEDRLNGPFSEGVIAHDVLNQAVHFHEIMDTPGLNNDVDDIIECVADNATKFEEYRNGPIANDYRRYMKYQPAPIKLSWTEIAEGCAITAAFGLVCYFASDL